MARRPRLVSVVIPARNATATIATQLEAVVRQRTTVPFEVVVVDNASSDATAAAAFAGPHPEVRVVDAPREVGRSYARNVGTAVARGDLLAYCDADDVVAPGWLEALVAGAVTADLVGGRSEEWMSEADRERMAGWGRARVDGVVLPRPMGHRPIAPGGNCATWRDVLERAGGWNERYPRCNDTELSWRVVRGGGRIVEAPDAVVRNRRRVTTREAFHQRFGWEAQHVHLFRDFRDDGIARDPWSVVLRDWAGLAIRLPNLARGRRYRNSWLRRAAIRSGRIWGSVRYRTLYL